MSFRDETSLWTTLASAELTYPEHGATRGLLPSGYGHLHRDAVIGAGQATFDKAVTGLVGWQMHRGAGIAVSASEPIAAPGVLVALRIGWGPLRIVAPCRVVYRIQQPDLWGFAYGTLPGHPEQGEEAFMVHLASEGEVRVIITAFSRPASLAARAGGLVTRKIQTFITDRYIRSLQRLASE